MPRVSEFFGIVISMFYKDHVPPHFHATYGEHDATIGIDPVEVLEGSLPRRVRSLVFEWAAMYQAQLRQDWELTRRREPLRRIPPLD